MVFYRFTDTLKPNVLFYCECPVSFFYRISVVIFTFFMRILRVFCTFSRFLFRFFQITAPEKPARTFNKADHVFTFYVRRVDHAFA